MRRVIIAVLMIVGVLGWVLVPKGAFASDPVCSSTSGVDRELREAAGCSNTDTIKSPIRSVVNTLLWVVGVLAVIMIIVSGLKMTTSAGNPGAVQKAKQTLIYALVGLVIAVLAYAIVNFVLDKVLG
ncbi:hypothetical protein IJG20_01685 [Candidatus Saccharibacteria bacterium]|nr:hypothetical protein [Candidatus Saccharibacteria bacterium]